MLNSRLLKFHTDFDLFSQSKIDSDIFQKSIFDHIKQKAASVDPHLVLSGHEHRVNGGGDGGGCGRGGICCGGCGGYGGCCYGDGGCGRVGVVVFVVVMVVVVVVIMGVVVLMRWWW